MSDQQQPEYSRPTSKADVKAAKAHYKASRPWYKKKRILLPLALLVIIVISVAANSGGSDPKAPTTASEDTSSSATPTPEDKATASSSAKATPKPKPAEPKAMKVRAAKILKDFDSNEAAADAKYSGKHLRITGVVNKVDTELLDDDQYIVEIGSGSDYEFVYVNCDDQSPSVAAKINKGDHVTVTADFEDGGDLGVEVKNCKLA